MIYDVVVIVEVNQGKFCRMSYNIENDNYGLRQKGEIFWWGIERGCVG